jgi:methyl-accepting chemotaxis protein
MKLSLKLPLAFAATLLLMLAAALYGIYSLNQSLDRYATEVQADTDNELAVNAMASEFKGQVQEWKNTLLRAKNPKDLDKHWAAFAKHERDTAERAKQLQDGLAEGEIRQILVSFGQAHAEMGEHYRKAFEAFKAADFDAAVGDAMVRGKDRDLVRLLEEATEKIAAASRAVSAEAAAQGRRATIVSLLVMLLTWAIGVAVGVLLCRGIVRQLGGEPQAAAELARLVAQGDLSVQLEVKPSDTVSLMAQLKQMQDGLARVVGQVRGNAESVAAASSQIAQGNNDLSSRTEEQASALEETAA